MSKNLVINRTLNEWRAALVENREIIDFLMERVGDSSKTHPRVGNIYKGKVLRVLPGMQSAFVDIGFEKAAFLYVDDAYLPSLEEQHKMVKTLEGLKKKKPLRGEIIPDELSTFSEEIDMKLRPDTETIESFLKEGDDIIVQIAKEPISTKGPRVTRHVSLPGRYVVYMPYVNHTGVSRRIENEEERSRLKEMIDRVKTKGKGIIVRTVAEGASYKTLKYDYDMLVKIWKEVSRRLEGKRSPSLCYEDLTFIQRILRDITDEDVDKIVIDDIDGFKEVQKFTSKYLPEVKGKVELYNGSMPIFEKNGLDIEIERGISNKVYLRSGGSLNIDQTEALVAVDVNTGKFVGRKTLEETILRTNMEAVHEIAYQLRLRNCGGIIIIDFIDMEKEENRKIVYESLLEAFKKDRAKTKVLPISDLGLVEMTRKRTRDTLTRILCEPCPYCEGIGQVKSVLTVCYELVRELTKKIKRTNKGKKISIFAHPKVTERLCGEELDLIETLENGLGVSLQIRSENSYHLEQYEIFC